MNEFLDRLVPPKGLLDLLVGQMAMAEFLSRCWDFMTWWSAGVAIVLWFANIAYAASFILVPAPPARPQLRVEYAGERAGHVLFTVTVPAGYEFEEFTLWAAEVQP